jgi:uncharacterized membrane protein YraQ (UPF0718 family)
MSTQILKSTLPRDDRHAIAKVGIGALGWVIAYSQLEYFAHTLTYSILRLEPETRLADSVEYFLADVPKILLLLSGMIFGITILRTFFSAERARRLLSGKRQGIGNLLAAMLGIITPFARAAQCHYSSGLSSREFRSA